MAKKTKILRVNPENMTEEILAEAAIALQKGRLVAFPTETVYGLGANGLDGQAVRKIFQAKGRPNDNPLILHIASWDDLGSLVSDIPTQARILAEKFWPGPLTMIFPKAPSIPKEVTAGLDTVAIRMPNHPVALELIRLAKLPLAAPSANLSGKPSPTTAGHVEKDLSGKIDFIIDGGSTGVGLESTVINLTSPYPTVLRPGGVTLEELKQVLGKVELDPALSQQGVKAGMRPLAPGMKYTHYSPDAQVILVCGQEGEKVKKKIRELVLEEGKGKKVAVMVTQSNQDEYPASVIEVMGSNQEEIANNLYQLLRKMDSLAVDLVIMEGVEYKGLGLAIMNRMEKAAGYHIVRV